MQAYIERHKTEPISANFEPQKKFPILNRLSVHYRAGKKNNHATVPLKGQYFGKFEWVS
jgi:hypothetical protein